MDLWRRKDIRVRHPFLFVDLCDCWWACACFLQSEQLVWVLPAGVLTCHWGSFGTAAQVHWVRGGARRCRATLGRNGPCGTRWGAFCQSGAAQHLNASKKARGSDFKETLGSIYCESSELKGVSGRPPFTHIPESGYGSTIGWAHSNPRVEHIDLGVRKGSSQLYGLSGWYLTFHRWGKRPFISNRKMTAFSVRPKCSFMSLYLPFLLLRPAYLSQYQEYAWC